ncbi:glycosyltransferase [Haloplanus salilacus]|uniref:glycosyltransferase n=1 Tax=Haloplanus salilacus TaxID=2949994 RepID=UPI0030D1D042
MDALFITAGDRTQASSRLRVYELLPHLEEAGISTESIAVPQFKSGLDGLWMRSTFASNILWKVLRNDIVFVQKIRFPTWFTQILSKISSTLIYDFDDAIHLAPPGKDVGQDDIRQHNTLIEKSDLTIAGSRELVEYARQYTDEVKCLHTGIPRKKYEQHQNISDLDEDSILLGWVGNPENLHYLSDVEREISEVLERHDNLSLRIITAGTLPIRPFKDREGEDVEYVEWTLDSALADLAEVDIGLRPLRDDEWTRSKGGFTSIVECLALGVPVVATPVSLVKYLIRNRDNGFLAGSPNEWGIILSNIAENPSEIYQMSQEAIKTVSSWRFWTEDTAKGLINIINEEIKKE